MLDCRIQFQFSTEEAMAASSETLDKFKKHIDGWRTNRKDANSISINIFQKYPSSKTFDVHWNEHPGGDSGVARTNNFECYYVLHKDLWYVSVFSQKEKWARIIHDEHSSKDTAIQFILEFLNVEAR